jgi:hypothetical protein
MATWRSTEGHRPAGFGESRIIKDCEARRQMECYFIKVQSLYAGAVGCLHVPLAAPTRPVLCPTLTITSFGLFSRLVREYFS